MNLWQDLRLTIISFTILLFWTYCFENLVLWLWTYSFETLPFQTVSVNIGDIGISSPWKSCMFNGIYTGEPPCIFCACSDIVPVGERCDKRNWINQRRWSFEDCSFIWNDEISIKLQHITSIVCTFINVCLAWHYKITWVDGHFSHIIMFLCICPNW